MKVGILGSGAVAQALGSGFLKHGHSVMLGTRDPAKLEDWKAKNSRGRVGSFEETATFGEWVVLSTKGSVAVDVLKPLASILSGKLVIDTTNPIADAPPQDGVLKFFTNLDESLLERLQKKYPNINFVKAFNSMGAAGMVNPEFKGGKPSMFICGNDAAAKKTVLGILDQFGWEVEDMGKAAAARAIEPLCMLWCIPGFLKNDWMHAFKLLR